MKKVLNYSLHFGQFWSEKVGADQFESGQRKNCAKIVVSFDQF